MTTLHACRVVRRSFVHCEHKGILLLEDVSPNICDQRRLPSLHIP